MRKYLGPALSGALVVGLFAAASSATADVADVDTTGSLATALDLPAGVTVIKSGTSNEMFGVASRKFNDFPRSGSGSYAVMSTGRATDLYNMGLAGLQPSTSFAGSQDSASLTFTVSPGTAGQCLLLDVAMGTEERVHTYTPSTAGDGATLTLNGVTTEYAKQAGPRFFAQSGVAMAPVNYTVNAVDYWHAIDDEFERQADDSSAPLLPAVTPFDSFTSVDTLQVPLGDNDPAVTDVVTLTVKDVNNNSLDTALLVDKVRLAPTCSTAAGAETGLYPTRNFEIVGHRGVNNFLSIDLIPETATIERYDAADNGWYPAGVDLRFRWYRGGCNNSGLMSDWTAIPDADRQSYSPTINDKGKCLLALVTGLKDGYRTETFPSPGSSSWKSTLAIQDGVFTSEDVPTISTPGGSSSIKVNDTLTATNGVFTPRPDSYSYQWYADDFGISGETGQTFKVTAAQSGKKIRVRVTAARLNFTNMAITSASTDPVDLLTMAVTPTPTVTGSGRVGEALTAGTGTWDPEGVAFTYQWYADGSLIVGATLSTFTPTATQVGKQVTVMVTGKRAGYQTVTKQSLPVVITLQGFTTAPTPTITGSGFSGDLLTVVPGVWEPVVTPNYQWYADNLAISGATAPTYRPTPNQAGQQIHVVATGVKPGYDTTSRQSLPVTVQLRQLSSTTPAIEGEAFVGSQVNAVTGTWTPLTTLTYQWLADGVPISGGTRQWFVLTEAQRGKYVKVRVTGTLTNYETVVLESAPVPVGVRQFITVAPVITGTLKVGNQVTATAGTWLPSPAGTTYEWYVGSRKLAAGPYYKIGPEVAGKQLRLVMTGTRQYYATASATVTSGKVAPGTLTSSAPIVTGSFRPGGKLSAVTGYWGPSPVSFRYQWYVGTKAIKGATKSSYKVSKSYKGKKIRVRVAGTKSGFTTVYRYSPYKKIAKK